jgi:hypothetical protein
MFRHKTGHSSSSVSILASSSFLKIRVRFCNSHRLCKYRSYWYQSRLFIVFVIDFFKFMLTQQKKETEGGCVHPYELEIE